VAGLELSIRPSVTFVSVSRASGGSHADFERGLAVRSKADTEAKDCVVIMY
jgi:hypothetical protein